jgi:hypothetical protein
MSYALIGLGKTGTAIAQAFADKGIEQLGFAPIEPGTIGEGGLLVQPRGSTWVEPIFQDLARFD